MYKKLKNVLNQENSLKKIISKILINLKISKYLIINQKGYKLHFFPSELSRVLWINPIHPHTASIFFSDYLRPGDTVIDVGSNIGTTTIQSSINVGKTGKIFSIEPNPTIYGFLLQNIKLNKLENIKTFNIAAGESDGEVNFSNKRSDVMNKIVDDDSKIKVKMTTIDKLLIDQDIFNLLKIDVIGYEKFVLLGSKNVLKKTQCVHFPVINEQYQNFKYSYEEIFEILRESGLQIYEFTNDQKIWRVKEEYTPNNRDMLAIRDISNFITRTNYKLIKN